MLVILVELRWPSWPNRSVCAAHEGTGNVVGIDTNGDCVWWDDDPDVTKLRWECLDVTPSIHRQAAVARACGFLQF